MNNPFLESLAQKLIRHILEAADKSQDNWEDIDLSLMRIIGKAERVTQLEERVRELEDAMEDTLAHRGPDWASILRYALKDKS